jgi:daunorubicin resistance ABC transporter membrane protein
MSPLAVASLWRREVVRFFRQPSRVGGAVGSPLLFWLLIGFGFSGSFRLPGTGAGVSFLEYFFPGTVALVVLFAAIFSTISVIEDRNEGFLQGVLAAPLSAADLVAGKVLGGATLAWLQGLLFLPLAPLAGIALAPGRVLAAAGVMALLALALTSVGFTCAWKVNSVQGFHAVMNLLLIPLWLLSGAFFPLAGAPPWLTALMRANPLTYGVGALRHALYGNAADAAGNLPSAALSLAVTAALAAAGLLLGIAVARRGRVR